MEKEIQWLLKEKYNNKPAKDFNRDVARLKAGEPLDYVIGFTEFLSCKIDLSKKTLIPRPETEFWVAGSIDQLQKTKKAKVLDMFSGSGCIGLSIVRHSKGTHVTFADNQGNAISQIKLNCTLNRISKDRHKVVKSDIFSNIKGNFDYIFANPPYIPIIRKSKIQKSVLDFEPSEALFGGGDGLKHIRRFLFEAKNHLNQDGKIFMEFDPPQKKEIEKIVKKNGYQAYKIHKDQYGKARWIVIK